MTHFVTLLYCFEGKVSSLALSCGSTFSRHLLKRPLYLLIFKGVLMRLGVSAVGLARCPLLEVLLGVKQHTAGRRARSRLGNQRVTAGIMSFPTHIPWFESF